MRKLGRLLNYILIRSSYRTKDWDGADKNCKQGCISSSHVAQYLGSKINKQAIRQTRSYVIRAKQCSCGDFSNSGLANVPCFSSIVASRDQTVWHWRNERSLWRGSECCVGCWLGKCYDLVITVLGQMHCPGSALEPLDIIVAREPEGQTPSIGERGWPCWPCTAPAPYCTFKHQGFPSSAALLINRPALRGDDVCILQMSSQQSTRSEVMLM